MDTLSNIFSELNLNWAIFSCDQCDYQTKTTGSLGEHCQALQRDNKFIMKDLNMNVTNVDPNLLIKVSLRRHRISLHAAQKYHCISSDYQAAMKGSLTTHQQLVHGNNYPCGSCDYQSSKRGNLTTHKQAHHEGCKYECNKCGPQITNKG